MRGAASTWIASPDAKAVNAEKSTEQHFAYRTTVKLAGPVRKAVLYATGEDTVSAWIDGAQVMTADKLPPWQQMPWRKFVRADVTDKVKAGANTIAIEAVHYVVDPNGMATADAPPMHGDAGGGVRGWEMGDVWQRAGMEGCYACGGGLGAAWL